MSTTQVTTKSIALNDTIQSLIDSGIDLKTIQAALTAKKPAKKPTEKHVIVRRETSNEIMKSLLSLSKTSKAVLAYLKNCDIETYKAMCSEKAREAIFADRYPQLLKSPSLVVKCFTPSEFENFVTHENKVTPNAYLKAIERGLAMSSKKWEEIRKK